MALHVPLLMPASPHRHTKATPLDIPRMRLRPSPAVPRSRGILVPLRPGRPPIIQALPRCVSPSSSCIALRRPILARACLPTLNIPVLRIRATLAPRLHRKARVRTKPRIQANRRHARTARRVHTWPNHNMARSGPRIRTCLAEYMVAHPEPHHLVTAAHRLRAWAVPTLVAMPVSLQHAREMPNMPRIMADNIMHRLQPAVRCARMTVRPLRRAVVSSPPHSRPCLPRMAARHLVRL